MPRKKSWWRGKRSTWLWLGDVPGKYVPAHRGRWPAKSPRPIHDAFRWECLCGTNVIDSGEGPWRPVDRRELLGSMAERIRLSAPCGCVRRGKGNAT